MELTILDFRKILCSEEVRHMIASDLQLLSIGRLGTKSQTGEVTRWQ